MVRLPSLAGIILLLLFVCGPVVAEQKPLLILRAGDWEPYHYKEDGVLKGHLITLLKKASDEAGIVVEFRTVENWNRCLRMMELGLADAFFPLFKSDEREFYMVFHEDGILDYEKDYFTTRVISGIQYSGNLKSLKDYNIGITTGYFYGKDFAKADYLRKIPARNEEKLIELLFADNRYDLILGNRVVIENIARKKQLMHRIRFLDPPLVNEPLYISFRKNIPRSILHKFTSAIAKERKRLREEVGYTE